MKNVAIVGDGGHGKVIRELINARSDTRLAAVLDDKSKRSKAEKNGTQDRRKPLLNCAGSFLMCCF